MRVLFKIAKEFGRFICRHRNTRLCQLLIRITEILRNSSENVNFDAKSNGEERYLRKISALKFKTILDVGANIGQWALMAGKIWPDSKIYSFEILPKHWKAFNENISATTNITLNKFGLSDFEGNVEVFYNDKFDADASATIYPQFLIDSEKERYPSKIKCEVKKGSQFIIDNSLHRVDLLKIDVEGHELKVIKGFGDSIRKVRLIQFEYGVYNITSRDLLCDFFQYLNNYDFVIGKLYPRNVDFFDYTYFKENFMGGNYLAVNKKDEKLIKLLSEF